MKYLFDTSLLLLWLRDGTARREIIRRYDPFGPENYPVISAVSIGEMCSLALQNGWGQKRQLALAQALTRFITTAINQPTLLRRYAEIDAYSQNRLASKPLGLTARNMGKNDLWIAATASVTDSTLLTTDRDFDHLNGVYLSLIRLQPEELRG